MSNPLSHLSFSELTGLAGLEAAANLFAVHDGSDANRLDIEDLHKMRVFLPSLTEYYENKLSETNPFIFFYLDEKQKKDVKEQLRRTYYLLFAQNQLDRAENQKRRHDDQTRKMARCIYLMDKLELAERGINPGSILLADAYESDKPVKFCGLTTLAPYIVDKIFGFIDSKVTYFQKDKSSLIREILSDINGHRLYWVWGGGFLSSVLNVLPDTFYSVTQAQQMLSGFSVFTGYLSWTLYYTRFAIEAMLFLKHTIKGPWMEDEEAKIPPTERFITQWNQRKFALLNDFIWATANMSCFFWLRGPGMLGYVGNVLTIGLLLMDLTLTVWRYYEESTAHNKRMLNLKTARRELKERLTRERAARKPNPETVAQLEWALKENAQLQEHEQMEWKYKEYGIINDLTYALGLVVGFALMTCFFFPPALILPLTASVLGIAGAAVSFVLTMAYSAVAGGIEIAKTRRLLKRSRNEAETLLKQFANADDVNMKKQLFLQYKSVIATTDYQRKMCRYQAVKLLRSMFIDALVPALVFASLVFMPLGVGLAVLGAGLALAVLSKKLLDVVLKPEEQSLPPFNKFEFDKFEKDHPALPRNVSRAQAESQEADGYKSDDETDDWIWQA